MEEDIEIRVRLQMVRKLLGLANELLGELDQAKRAESEGYEEDRLLTCKELQELWVKLNCNKNRWGAKLEIPYRSY